MQFNETDYQTKIYIHNEIFEELKVLHDKGSSHVAFTYTFYYLICWLYRYAKYGEFKIDVKMIKEMLGYNANNKKVDYLIKKGGLLDELGLTYSSTDYPVCWSFEDNELDFTMMSEMNEMRDMFNKGKNYKIKVPVKGLNRNGDEGTFYDISYTHEIGFDLFIKCMESDLGCSGFYLYGYLKYRCDKFGEYCSSLERLGDEVGMSKNTVDKYITMLCKEGLVSYKGNACKLIDGKFNKTANTYKVINLGDSNNIN